MLQLSWLLPASNVIPCPAELFLFDAGIMLTQFPASNEEKYYPNTIPANTGHSSNAVSMLGQRRRR